MKRLYSNVGSTKPALEQRPEVFHSIHMHAATDVGFGLIDHFMHEAPVHSGRVSNGLIGIDLAAILHVFKNETLQSFPRDVRHNIGANLTEIAVKNALHDGFVLVRARAFYLQAAILVHVLTESPD